MINLRHRIHISVANRKGERERIVSGKSLRLPQRLLKILFGDGTHILVITPGRTVEGIEIKEVADGGGENDR